MYNEKMIKEVEQTLEKDERLISEKKLLKNKIMELTLKSDTDLIKLLLSNPKIKKRFFTEVEKTLIFEKDKFIKFVNNNQFLPNSYTAFKNKIGLTTNGEYLSEKNDVSLVWPYKDCILEGGMTKEDQKRKEIFYNEILASDEIDRLKEPKVLTNIKRIDKDGEHKITEIKDTDNLIIKGNNLLALYSLRKKFSGRVKLIYIDPPYNADADTFYNDSFRHSTWLTFMKNRLYEAKELLSEDGAIFVQISDKEVGYLHILLDEVFERENFINKITIATRSPSGFKVVNLGLFESAEYILIYGKSKKKWKYLQQYESCDYDKNYNSIVINKEKSVNNWKIKPLKEFVAIKLGCKDEKESIKKVGKDYFEYLIATAALENSDAVFRLTRINDDAGKETLDLMKKSIKTPKAIFQLSRNNNTDRYIFHGQAITFYSGKVKELDGKKVPTTILTNIWKDIAWEGIAKEGGVKLNKGKKPEKLIKRILEMSTIEGDIVLDYHLGTGTTCAVAHKMKRQYIGIEQLNYLENDSVNRLKNVILERTSKIDDEIGWSGGGDFVYCELMKLNEDLFNAVEKAKTKSDIKKVWESISKSPYLNYLFDGKSFEQNFSEFEKLSIEEQKKFLLEILDKNQLYTNFSEIDDKELQISEYDKKINKQFYK
jgi:adenine-specific DNA-methyltransferase